ncbi:UDP-N-acetylmuramoyl-tripeptide--D-alanyl-D-alanine ligase [Croceiramulus getboli]|nr:UDP-N-acetylmuramoyl-tripeptide--D-alanyl-D-alanine ligase [Flavobacteriaceae bacterium YJPT1-3]
MKLQDLHKLFLNSPGISTDTRKIAPNTLFFALKGERFNGNAFAKAALDKGASYAIIDEAEYEQGERTILVEDALNTLQELAKYHRTYLNIPILALTGSNGKTTTKELIHAVLDQKFKTIATLGNLNNHIGVPLTLLRMRPDTEIGIVEMGANHQKEIAFLSEIAQPDYGYITNFGKAHLEGFGGVEGVIKGKSELYDYLRKHDKMAFVNADDALQLKQSKGLRTYTFGSTAEAHTCCTLASAQPFVSIQTDDTLIETQLTGAYNASNICAAIAIGIYFQVPVREMKQAIANYLPENNRSQLLLKGSNTVLLDAYNANPTSMEAALLSFDQRPAVSKMVILGDMFELGSSADAEHQQIAERAEALFSEVILVGAHFARTQTSDSTLVFKDFESLKQEGLPPIEGKTILIKGSRGMALERLLEML